MVTTDDSEAFDPHAVLTEDDVDEIMTAYHQLDSDENGCVTVRELCEGVQAVRQFQPSEIESIIAKLDRNHDGKVTVDEFLMARSITKGEVVCKADVEQITEHFAFIDADGSGSVTQQELGNMIRGMGLSVSEGDVGAMIRNADTDNDGCISLDEFIEVTKSMYALAQQKVEVMILMKRAQVLNLQLDKEKSEHRKKTGKEMDLAGSMLAHTTKSVMAKGDKLYDTIREQEKGGRQSLLAVYRIFAAKFVTTEKVLTKIVAFVARLEVSSGVAMKACFDESKTLCCVPPSQLIRPPKNSAVASVKAYKAWVDTMMQRSRQFARDAPTAPGVHPEPVQQQRQHLWRVFRFYCRTFCNGRLDINEMTAKAWSVFAADVRLDDRTKQSQRAANAQTIFAMACQLGTTERDSNTCKTLSFQQWEIATRKLLELIHAAGAAASVAAAAATSAMLSWRKLQGRSLQKANTAVDAAVALEERKARDAAAEKELTAQIKKPATVDQLMELVLTRVRSADATLLHELTDDSVLTVLSRHMWSLKSVFNHYAEGQSGYPHETDAGLISLKGFERVLTTFGMPLSSASDAWTLETLSQEFDAAFIHDKINRQEKRGASQTVTSAGAGSAAPPIMRLGFSGFVELICRCALLYSTDGSDTDVNSAKELKKAQCQAFDGCDPQIMAQAQSLINKVPWRLPQCNLSPSPRDTRRSRPTSMHQGRRMKELSAPKNSSPIGAQAVVMNRDAPVDGARRRLRPVSKVRIVPAYERRPESATKRRPVTSKVWSPPNLTPLTKLPSIAQQEQRQQYGQQQQPQPLQQQERVEDEHIHTPSREHIHTPSRPKATPVQRQSGPRLLQQQRQRSNFWREFGFS
jgi:calcium-binding protein CML